MRFQELSNFNLPVGFRGKPGWYVQLWWLVQSLFFKPSLQFMYRWRNFLLRLFGAHIGKGVIIRPSAHIQFPWKLEIGDYSWIGDHVVLYNLSKITIGTNAVISQRSYICTGTHDFTKPNFPIEAYPISIEDEAWIATDVFVGPGVTIGKGAVIGARSSVFKSLDGGKVYIGSPAKFIKERFINESVS
jgi:putative colanic acid biosynthesis acetyltransferase WcaF